MGHLALLSPLFAFASHGRAPKHAQDLIIGLTLVE